MNENMFDVCFLCFILSHIAAYTDTWAIQQPFHHIIYHFYTGASHASVQKCHCIVQLIVHIHNIMHLYSHSCQQCDDIIFAMQYFHYSLILCCLRKSRFNLCQKQRSCLSSEICYTRIYLSLPSTVWTSAKLALALDLWTIVSSVNCDIDYLDKI